MHILKKIKTTANTKTTANRKKAFDKFHEKTAKQLSSAWRLNI